MKNYAEEFLAALENRVVTVPVDSDEDRCGSCRRYRGDDQRLRPENSRPGLKGHPFAHFVGHLLNTMGYRTRVSPEGPDGGVDIVAHRDELRFSTPIIKVQVKSTEGKIGDPEVSSLYGKVGPNEHGLLVTLGSFTAAASNFGKSKSNLRLIDGEQLVDLVLAHYEEFDSRYKGILPLKRVSSPNLMLRRRVSLRPGSSPQSPSGGRAKLVTRCRRVNGATELDANYAVMTQTSMDNPVAHRCSRTGTTT